MEVIVEILQQISVEVSLPIQFVESEASVAVNYSDGSPSPIGSIEAPGSVNIPQHSIKNSEDTVLDSGEYDEDLVAADGRAADSQANLLANIPSGTIVVLDDLDIKRQLQDGSTEGSVHDTAPLGEDYVIPNAPITDSGGEQGKYVHGKTIQISGATISSVQHGTTFVRINIAASGGK